MKENNFHEKPFGCFYLCRCYEQIRRSGFLSLPHRTTLNRYTGFTRIGTGFNPDIIKHIYDDVKLEELKKFEKHIILLFHEMKIKSRLVYSKSSGTISGLMELGDINEELNEFDRAINGVNQEKKLASHVLCVMARGLFKHINYPLGYFSSCGFDSAQLFPVLWHATGILKMAGFKVDAMVSDGASPFISYISWQTDPTSQMMVSSTRSETVTTIQGRLISFVMFLTL